MKFNPESLKAQRKAAGLTLEQLAHASSLSKNTVWGLEAGATNPSMKTLQKLASGLKVEWSIFFENNTQIFGKEHQEEGAA